jgi:hypothetical protein
MSETHGASLLERMIARLVTQRDLLATAAELIQAIEGPVLEVGLGKGRTYDHLRRLLPGRMILAFDRDLHAPAAAAPDADHLLLGEFAQTLAAAAVRIGRTAALVHADFGSPDRAHDSRQAQVLGPLLQRLVVRRGVVLADRELAVEGWVRLPIEPAPAWPYFLWRVEG